MSPKRRAKRAIWYATSSPYTVSTDAPSVSASFKFCRSLSKSSSVIFEKAGVYTKSRRKPCVKGLGHFAGRCGLFSRLRVTRIGRQEYVHLRICFFSTHITSQNHCEIIISLILVVFHINYSHVGKWILRAYLKLFGAQPTYFL